MKKCKLDLAKKLTGKQKRELKKQFPETPQELQNRLLKKMKREENIDFTLFLIAELFCLGYGLYLLYLCLTGQMFL